MQRLFSTEVWIEKAGQVDCDAPCNDIYSPGLKSERLFNLCTRVMEIVNCYNALKKLLLAVSFKMMKNI